MLCILLVDKFLIENQMSKKGEESRRRERESRLQLSSGF